MDNGINLIYFHTGPIFPDYIFDSIYQTILWNKSDLKVWILTDLQYLKRLEEDLDKIDNKSNIQFRCIPIEIYKDKIPKMYESNAEFRGNFWNNTLVRFFYIYEFIKQFDLKQVFHIENDVMIYKEFKKVYLKYKSLLDDKLVSIQDSEHRAISSYIYIDNSNVLKDFTEFIKTETNDFKIFKNDMEIMGSYKNKNSFNCLNVQEDEYLFDAAAIGQYLGGVDPRNTTKEDTRGFINETSLFKPNEYTFKQMEINSKRYWTCKKDESVSDIVNLHVHSKKLYEFSSDKLNFDLTTGELIMDKMDVIFLTGSKFIYHNNYFNKKLSSLVIKINDDYDKLSESKIKTIEDLVKSLRKENNIEIVKIFVYGDNLREWYNQLFKRLNVGKIDLYSHNSDENIYKDELIKDLLDNENVNVFYSQNLCVIDKKAKLLPIGLGNSQWEHGNIQLFKDVLNKTYKYKKIDKIYVNFNDNTYIHRSKYKEYIKNLKDEINFFVQENNLSYKEYLNELSRYKYCLCPRGNGLDTHRFWECIYLGVVPIVINNKQTKSSEFYKILKSMNINFIELESINEIYWVFLNKSK